MVAPFPPVALPGGVDYRQRAETVARLYENVARFAERIVTAAPDVSLIDVGDLAYGDGDRYVREANNTSPEFRKAVIAHLELGRGYSWEGTPTQNQKVADLGAIRDELIAFKAWVDLNLVEIATSGQGAGYIVYSSASNSTTTEAKTVPNTHGVVAEAQKIRNLYTA